ncbi:DUF6636 domain-containing protein [Actinoplanes sp. CA-142083]|uniref:DUF6636 domain-containing protein n=1 Tax=Actinoplanes sp. CA-142083 TaxID=3239903 RepID=UPI003D8B28A3
MGRIRGLFGLALAGLALAACSGSPSGSGSTGGAGTPSARAGFGGPPPPAVDISDVGEEIFQAPSNNIFCSLTASAVRCDIVRKTWAPPSKPADCELDWGNGMYIEAGKAGITCTGDTLIGSAKQTLDYGKGLRSGTVVCESVSTGLTCRDEKTKRGFTLAVARYSIF